jgi:DNA-binding transcriptional MerR regulator
MSIGTKELMEKTGISLRQVNYWCRMGLIMTINAAEPGSGYQRQFYDNDVDKIKRMVQISHAFDGKISLNVLSKVYARYEEGMIELENGIILDWSDGMEIQREYYYHDAGCPANRFTEPNENDLRTCLDCAGIFDHKGNGVCVTDRRFDENYVSPNTVNTGE